MRLAMKADWFLIAQSITAITTPGVGPIAAVTPLLGLVGGILQHLTH